MLFPVIVTAFLGWWAYRIIKRENDCPFCTSKGFCHMCWVKYMRKLDKEDPPHRPWRLKEGNQ